MIDRKAVAFLNTVRQYEKDVLGDHSWFIRDFTADVTYYSCKKCDASGISANRKHIFIEKSCQGLTCDECKIKHIMES